MPAGRGAPSHRRRPGELTAAQKVAHPPVACRPSPSRCRRRDHEPRAQFRLPPLPPVGRPSRAGGKRRAEPSTTSRRAHGRSKGRRPARRLPPLSQPLPATGFERARGRGRPARAGAAHLPAALGCPMRLLARPPSAHPRRSSRRVGAKFGARLRSALPSLARLLALRAGIAETVSGQKKMPLARATWPVCLAAPAHRPHEPATHAPSLKLGCRVARRAWRSPPKTLCEAWASAPQVVINRDP